jgi:NADP-dependent 3-hydroxy acid dehydrogenase YdfG
MSSTTAADPKRSTLGGRTALVTGASRGIGAECVRLLLAAGARVHALGRDARAFDSLHRAKGTTKADATFTQVDLSDAAALAKALPALRRDIGTPDIIVNNAGHFFIATAEETSVADFDRTLQVNLSAPFGIVREFLGDMRKRASGHLVTIGSIADHRAFPGNAAYAASKYGVRAMHEVLREELRGSGVRATLVSPGPTNTDLWDPVNPDEREGFTKRADMLPPAAVADAVLYAVTCPPSINVDELRLSRS